MKIAMLATMLLALSGTALAGAEAYVIVEGSETHSLYLYVGDDGTVTLLVDGEPVGIPTVPGAPELPDAPEVPEAPGIPEVPTLPETPAIPETPTVPELPPIPALP